MAAQPDPGALERSYWLHASLAPVALRGYWAPDTPFVGPPSDSEIKMAARLLCGHYGANRLYLMYHREVLPSEAYRILSAWRRYCPREVEIIPTLVLVMYDRARTPVFGPIELRAVCRFLKANINRSKAATYDVEAFRDPGPLLKVMQEEYPAGLIRVGIQPAENIVHPFASAVQDTWSGMCLGRTNEDWQSPGFGAETLARWVMERDGSQPVAWDLVAVAWDYEPTVRGEYPGYDDAARNMALPAGRNLLAARLILNSAHVESLAGFSSDLFIVQANSSHPRRDGQAASLYECLRQGRLYRGYFAEPLEEIAAIYRTLRSGRRP